MKMILFILLVASPTAAICLAQTTYRLELYVNDCSDSLWTARKFVDGKVVDWESGLDSVSAEAQIREWKYEERAVQRKKHYKFVRSWTR